MAKFLELKPNDVKVAVWEMVIEAWENGLSDKEAAFRVSNHEGMPMLKASDIQKWCYDDPEVAELRANLQSSLLSDTKLVLAKTIRDSGNKEQIKTARWYAERKGAEEFSTKSAVALEGAVIGLSIDEKQKLGEELLEKFRNGGE